MLPDRPFGYINYLDLPDAQRLFRDLQDIISHIESLMDGEGLLIGIKGDWGTGKTSILRALESYFKDYKGFPIVFFEAWKYQDERHPLVPLLIKMKEVAPANIRKKLRNITKIFLGSSLILADVFLSSITKGLGKEIGIDEVKSAISSVEELSLKRYSEFEENFGKLKASVNEIIDGYKSKSDKEAKEKWGKFVKEVSQSSYKYLVIFIDDLDRLLPEKGLRLLEMIRFYLNIPKTLVIMGINDKVLTEHITRHYNLKEGEEFLEKVFQWSYELSSIPFTKDYMAKMHFRDLQERATIDDNIYGLFGVLDPLTHRKWVKIANRMEMKIKEKGGLYIRDAWLSIIEECFPKIEMLLRKIPNLKGIFSEDVNGLKRQCKHIFDEIENMAKVDTTFLHFPMENFHKLCEYQERLAKEEI